jgi:hypothetical protein
MSWHHYNLSFLLWLCLCLRSLLWVSDKGTVHSHAGSGTSGYVDGIGSAALFNGPTDMTLNHNNGDLYIADEYVSYHPSLPFVYYGVMFAHLLI